MTEQRMTADPVRRLGRPDQQASEELVRHIVETATRLFITQGYAATSIEQVAAAAGSGKQTIYRRFTSKEGLFTEVINRQARRLIEFAEAASSASGADPVAALKEICRQLFDFLLSQDAIRLQRILIAESVRFPALGEFVLENCTGPFDALLKRLLAEAMEAGQIRRISPDLAHAVLTSLFSGGVVKHALLGAEPFKSAAERDAYFDEAWGLFLRGAR